MTTFHPSFCPSCGAPLASRYVPDEGRERLVCTQCDRIHYINPIVVAGVLPVAEGRIWLLRRAIEPRYGAWTFPAGYMEMGESVAEAAVRETREELNLEVRLGNLFNVYSLPTMSSVTVVYLAEALGEPSIGQETLDFASFAPDEVPWPDLAFWSTQQALRDWVRLVAGSAAESDLVE
jgi:ADP-ribose pyrophosphatase YjhB (NUDIX family)